MNGQFNLLDWFDRMEFLDFVSVSAGTWALVWVGSRLWIALIRTETAQGSTEESFSAHEQGATGSLHD
jgi:hypothetical protein